MSISEPLAVTMMIGTRLRLRSSRHTSMPETRGSITSSSTRSGCTTSKSVEGLGAVAGDLHPEALALEADGEGVDEAVLVLDDEDRGVGVHASSRLQVGVDGAPGPAGSDERERGALALAGRRPGTRRRGCWRRGGRWRGRGRCRRSRGCGPGRPGRSARRCARGRGSGCRRRGRARRSRRWRRPPRRATSTATPGSEYFVALSSRL